MRRILSKLTFNIIIVAIMLSVWVNYAYAQQPDGSGFKTIVNDTFDDFTLTGGMTLLDIRGWSGTAGDGSIAIVPLSEENKNGVKIDSERGNSPFLNRLFPNSTGKIVIELMVMFDGGKIERTVSLRDTANKLFSMFQVQEGTGDILTGDKKIGTYEDGKWYKMSVCLDTSTKAYTFYMDGQEVGQGIMPEKMSNGVKGVKIEQPSVGRGGSLCFDNFRVYGSDKPLGDEMFKVENVKKDTNDIYSQKLAGAVAMVVNCPHAYINGERVAIDKSSSEVKPVLADGSVLVPARFIADAFNAKVDWNPSDSSVTIDSNGHILKMTVNNTKAAIDGAEKLLDAAPQIMGSRVMVPVRAFAEAIGKKIFWDERGYIYISDNPEPFKLPEDSDLVLELMNRTIFDRPDAFKIISDLKAMNSKQSHPRILARTEDFEAIKANIKNDATAKAWYDALKKNADNIITQPVSVYKRSDNRRLDNMTTTRDRIQLLSFMYKVSGDTKYAQRAWDELNAVANYPNWNPDPEFLDLANITASFGIAYDWLFDYLSKDQKDIVRNAIVNKGLNVGLDSYRNNAWWTTTPFNWNAVCNGGLAVGALAVADEAPDVAGQVLQLGIRSLEYHLPMYADGSYTEGLGYWGYAISYIVNFIGSLDTACGTDYGLSDVQGFDKTALFPAYMTGPEGTFNFSDAGGGNNAPEMFWFAKKLNDPSIVGLRLSMMQEYKFSPAMRDLLWYDPSFNASPETLPLDVYYKNIETALFRKDWDDGETIFAGIHGGNNSDNHSHYDKGTFVLDALGQRWFEDLGSDHLSYILNNYPGVQGSDIYRLRAEGHNVPVINPGNGPGQLRNGTGRIIKTESKPKGAYAIEDLTDVYRDNISKAMRGLALTDNRNAVVVQDEITTLNPSELWWFAHTHASIQVSQDGKSAVLTRNNKKLWAQILTNNGKFQVMDAAPLPTSPNPKDQASNKGIKKLAIHLTNVTDLRLSVAFIPLENGQIQPDTLPEVTPLGSWNIPDGSAIAPTASGILLDGKPLEGFDNSKKQYYLKVPAQNSSLPKIDVKSDGNVSINIEGDQVKIASILITDKNDPTLKTRYMIYFERYIDPNSKLKIANVTASSVPQPENSPENTLDGSLDTRWSAQGTQWIMYDLGGVETVGAVSIAIYNGTQRNQELSIELSADGQNWNKVYDGSSSGTTGDLEAYLFNPAQARYVRINCTAPTAADWDSLTEVEVYKP